MSFFRKPAARRILYALLFTFALVRVGHRLLQSYSQPPLKAGEVVHVQH